MHSQSNREQQYSPNLDAVYVPQGHQIEDHITKRNDQ